MIRTHQPGQAVFKSILPEDIDWKPFPAFPPSVRLAVVDSGRTLTDDAGDAFLAILTNGKVTEDKVDAHGDPLAEFPYLGPPRSA
jgi:hypothetical protein